MVWPRNLHLSHDSGASGPWSSPVETLHQKDGSGGMSASLRASLSGPGIPDLWVPRRVPRC